MSSFGFLDFLEDGVSAALRQKMRRAARRFGVAPEEYVVQVAKGILFGESDVVLSVQGSCMHASEPKLSVPYKEYEAFEVVLLRDGKFESVAKVFGGDSEVQAKMEPYLMKVSKHDKFYARVPKAVVQELFEALEAKFGKARVA